MTASLVIKCGGSATPSDQVPTQSRLCPNLAPDDNDEAFLQHLTLLFHNVGAAGSDYAGRD